MQLSDHLTLLGDKKGAEDILVRAELYKEAVDMLNNSGQWERAYTIAEKYLGSEIVRDMFVEMAGKLEQEGKYRDCERVFIAINEPDLAISMYERLEQYEPMIRLVERYHKDLLDNTHLHIAKQLETKSKYKMAEGHFLLAGDWKAAVHMYCSVAKWEEAHRVATQKGTEDAANQVAYIWSRSLPLEGAARLLIKMNLIRTALLYACDAKQFEFALDLCRLTGHPNDEVHLRIAMDLEDEGKVHHFPFYLFKSKCLFTLPTQKYFIFSSMKRRLNFYWLVNPKKQFLCTHIAGIGDQHFVWLKSIFPMQ